GLDIHGVLTGVRVLSHRETPGLGDAIELRKSDWILGFNGKSLGNPAEDAWRIKKDSGHFDGLTGATVTPRAVVQQVHHALRYFAEDGARLLAPAPAQTSAPTAPSEKPHE
ncbi:MAG: RnfABCDGE type electron transport complex subunit G, partial [Porticoccaceae bacterium]